jgi:hypothetical protein
MKGNITVRGQTIALLRKQIPAMMAQQIAGVQPMSTPEWRTGEGKGQIQELEYWIQPPQNAGEIFNLKSKSYLPPNPHLATMQIWCEHTFGMEYARGWYRNSGAFYFLNEADRTAFALKWM